MHELIILYNFTILNVKKSYDKIIKNYFRGMQKMIESEVFKRYQLPIEELRPKIIDTIVEVYGKRHRAQIEDRLNNLYIN